MSKRVMGLLDSWAVPILVWPFHLAPAELLEPFAPDDADWLALIPAARLPDAALARWLDMPAFGSCRVEEKRTEWGVVRVGYHA